jgi:hypothetical protein
MVCKVCRKNNIDRIIAESKKAMKRYTAKLKEEKICRTQVNKKEIDLKEK